jgi:hypothetical protein
MIVKSHTSSGSDSLATATALHSLLHEILSEQRAAHLLENACNMTGYCGQAVHVQGPQLPSEVEVISILTGSNQCLT